MQIVSTWAHHYNCAYKIAVSDLVGIASCLALLEQVVNLASTFPADTSSKQEFCCRISVQAVVIFFNRVSDTLRSIAICLCDLCVSGPGLPSCEDGASSTQSTYLVHSLTYALWTLSFQSSSSHLENNSFQYLCLSFLWPISVLTSFSVCIRASWDIHLKI